MSIKWRYDCGRTSTTVGNGAITWRLERTWPGQQRAFIPSAVTQQCEPRRKHPSHQRLNDNGDAYDTKALRETSSVMEKNQSDAKLAWTGPSGPGPCPSAPFVVERQPEIGHHFSGIYLDNVLRRSERLAGGTLSCTHRQC